MISHTWHYRCIEFAKEHPWGFRMKTTFLGPLVAVGVCAAALVGASQAQATVILSGNSNASSFTNGVGTGCPSGSATSITLGSTAGGGTNSTLSILSVPFSASGAITG